MKSLLKTEVDLAVLTNPTKMSGKLIAFYGINNIGKSTHTKRLVEKLITEGYDAHYLKYPAYDIEPSGQYINRVLREGIRPNISEQELQMWYTINRFQYQDTLKKRLENGEIIIAEDYTGTGIGWGFTKGAELEWLEQMNKYLLKEDLSILMFGERAMHMKESGHLHESNDDLVSKAGETFFKLAERYNWHKVELQDEKDQTAELIWDIVKTIL